jgi:CRISPR-associated protein Cmr4
MSAFRAFLLETLTNAHVGAGDVTYGVVDNVIQRDPVTSIPVFYSSSVKGALRDHFSDLLKQEPDTTKNDFRQMKLEVFGKEFKDKTEPQTSASPEQTGEAAKNHDNKIIPGKAIFMEARLLTLPLRSSQKVYYNCTSKDILVDCIETLIEFTGENPKLKDLRDLANRLSVPADKDFLIFDNTLNVEIEDYNKAENKTKAEDNNKLNTALQNFFGIPIDNFAIFKEDIFKEICESGLPVIARNQLKDDGESENLFYDEILPRRARLYMLIGQGECNKTQYDKFCDKLTSSKHIQFGGNFSIGYGMTRISKIPLTEEAR